MKTYDLAAAEADLRDAIDRDDHATIARLEPIIDSLDPHKDPVAMISAALWFAEQGLHVFPLSPGTKIPLKGSGGCLDATTDAEQIRAWWTTNPRANVAVATGHLIDVVDVDGFPGQASRAKHWDGLFDKIDTDSVAKVLTPRPGGMHLWVPATGDGNSTNIVPSVDYRGVGGYVVAPPSVNEQGRYRFLGDVRLEQIANVA